LSSREKDINTTVIIGIRQQMENITNIALSRYLPTVFSLLNESIDFLL
jgi:hypothetical protein